MSRWYRLLYRFRITPWESDSETLGSQIDALLTAEEAHRTAPYGTAVDLGCGMGRWSNAMAGRAGMSSASMWYLAQSTRLGGTQGPPALTSPSLKGTSPRSERLACTQASPFFSMWSASTTPMTSSDEALVRKSTGSRLRTRACCCSLGDHHEEDRFHREPTNTTSSQRYPDGRSPGRRTMQG